MAENVNDTLKPETRPLKILHALPRVTKVAELMKNLLCPQVKRSSGKRLRQRRWDQNHHEDHISRGCHPEARKLREKVAFCFFRFQTAGL